ncbi:MAG TPA: hypothetical protein GX711_03605 [Clostridia bacterium]|nr:hypothetical protein [Clostridia bacterium]
MLKRLVNEAILSLTIKNSGPLLIKSGYAEAGGCDMEPVQTYRNGRLEYYIPGSSLKGVLRSHFEKIARTLNPEPGTVCDPFSKVRMTGGKNGAPVVSKGYAEVSCGNKFQLNKMGKYKEKSVEFMAEPIDPTNEHVYKNSCPACRLFGSTFFAGRFNIGDGYLKPGSKPGVKRRDLVGIDRLTGGASSGAKFDLSAIGAGAEFETGIYLRNFECWQLGALFILLDDLKDGLIRLGSGVSRGFGEVTSSFDNITLTRVGRNDGNQTEIAGLGRILGDGSYGTFPDDFLLLDSLPESEVQGVRTAWRFNGKYLSSLRTAAAAHFVNKIEKWPPQEEMKWDPGRWERVAGA